MKRKLNVLMVLALLGVLVGGSARPARAQGGISDVHPREGTVGTELTLSGSGFGWKRGEVLLGVEKCKVLDWRDTRIKCMVVKPQPPDFYSITVLAQGAKKPAEPMTFSAFAMRRPKIIPGALGPAWDGERLTIEGAFFGDRTGEVDLWPPEGGGGVEGAKVIYWSMDAIRFELPHGLTGRFVLVVRNEVGAGAASLGLGDGPPVLGDWQPPNPDGYGHEDSYDNSSGVYYKGKFYVFSIRPKCVLCGNDSQKVDVRTFSNGHLSDIDPSFPPAQTNAFVPALVIKEPSGVERLWVFHTGGHNDVYYTRYTYDEGTGTGGWDSADHWNQILDIHTKDTYEVAPVYIPTLHRLIVYYEYNSYVNWVYTDDFGANWKLGDTEKNRVTYLDSIYSAPSAVHYEPSGATYNTLLAVKDTSTQVKVYALYNGYVQGNPLTFTVSDSSERPSLMDDMGDYIRLIYSNDYGRDKETPTERRMNKHTAVWDSTEYHPVQLPPDITDGESGKYWFTSIFAPNGAVNCENGRLKMYIFYGWYFAAVFCYDMTDAKWTMTNTYDLGACTSP